MEKSTMPKAVKRALSLGAGAVPKQNPFSFTIITLGMKTMLARHEAEDLLSKVSANPKLSAKAIAQKHDEAVRAETLSMNSTSSNPTLSDHVTVAPEVQQHAKPIEAAKKYNPEKVPVSFLKQCQEALHFAELSYFPESYEHMTTAVFSNVSSSLFASASFIKKKESKASVASSKSAAKVPFMALGYRSKAKLGKPCFMFGLDLSRKRMVVAVRGTASIEDALTDLTCEPVKFTIDKHYKENLQSTETVEGWVHAGFLDGARSVLKKLKEPLIHAMLKYPEYANNLLVTGHSMGGGVATLLGIVLREEFKKGTIQREARMSHKYNMKSASPAEHERIKNLRPSIEVINFAPAAVLCETLSRWSIPFVTSFVLEGDLVARAAAGQMDKLQKEIIKGEKGAPAEDPVENLAAPMSTLSSLHTLGTTMNKKTKEVNHRVYVYPPGDIYMYIIESPTPNEKKYIVRNVDATHFDRIVFSSRMFADHALKAHQDAMDAVISTFAEFENAVA